MLKRLFYASASILMLALAYHLGAQTARAQAGTIAAANVNQQGGSDGAYSIVVGRTLYGFRPAYPEWEVLTVPGTSPVIACDYYGPGLGYALLENGDSWLWSGSSPPGWRYLGNVFGAVTPAAQPTWGQLKAQYRK